MQTGTYLFLNKTVYIRCGVCVAFIRLRNRMLLRIVSALKCQRRSSPGRVMYPPQSKKSLPSSQLATLFFLFLKPGVLAAVVILLSSLWPYNCSLPMYLTPNKPHLNTHIYLDFYFKKNLFFKKEV